jgi:hypothetical protein
MKNFAVGLIALSFLLSNCSNGSYSKDIAELDSLKTKVVTAKQEFKTLDSTLLNKINHQVFEDLRFIKRYYKPDTLSMENSEQINRYKEIRKNCAKYFMFSSRLKKNLPYTKVQLENLIHDLKNNTLGNDEATKYIDIERKSTIALLEAMQTYKTGIQQVKTSFDSLQPKINLIMKIAVDTLTAIK